jgi:hypothetical protein
MRESFKEPLATAQLLHSTLIALAVGFVVLYRGCARRAPMTGAVAIGAVLPEHCSQNAILIGGFNPHAGEFCVIITLGGRLCALLLALGLCYVTTIEWDAFTPLSPLGEWLQLSTQEAHRRAGRLAVLQAGRPHS